MLSSCDPPSNTCGDSGCRRAKARSWPVSFDARSTVSEIASMSSTTPHHLVTDILTSISARYAAICVDPPSAIVDWPSRLAYRGQTVSLYDGARTRTGTVQGLDESGALILSTSRGDERISSGELTRGPRVS